MSNKYSIVTGASRGLGAAIAEELAREGYDVVITYCTQADKAQKVKKQLETKFGVRVESYQLDIKDEEAVLAFRKWVEETLGTNLQVLVNNAGIYANMPAEEIASKTFCDCKPLRENHQPLLCGGSARCTRLYRICKLKICHPWHDAGACN